MRPMWRTLREIQLEVGLGLAKFVEGETGVEARVGDASLLDDQRQDVDPSAAPHDRHGKSTSEHQTLTVLGTSWSRSF